MPHPNLNCETWQAVRRRQSWAWPLWSGLWLLTWQIALLASPRGLPQPLPSPPGHVFVTGQNVVVPLTSNFSGNVILYDYEDQIITSFSQPQTVVNAGKLPVGFYRLRREGGNSNEWISLGVLAPLKAPTPDKSPVAVDVAMAWFCKPERMEAMASLGALAGVNWVRDRLAWGQLEPQRGQFAAQTRYDLSAQAQATAQLKILQVNHSSPAWANPESHHRFPMDLRDTFNLHREMARRWLGKVQAFEPWNEADIPQFGGHTGAEMASLQKAAYFGIKAGNPDAIAGLNVLAHHRAATLSDLAGNEVLPYCDTFNFHHYEPLEAYAGLYADFRRVAGGRPLWVTECARPVAWSGDPELKEPSDSSLRQQAERLVKTYALSLFEGSSATFYFMLPHYVEHQTQFGLLRPDFTPRPGYLSLAAMGRLLADARPRGRVASSNANFFGYVFRAKPDGQSRDVLVAWTLTNEITVNFAGKVPSDIYDHLGRTRSPIGSVLKVKTAPLLAVFPSGSGFKLHTPPTLTAPVVGTPSPLVLQAQWPTNRVSVEESAYLLEPNTEETIPLWLYHFGRETAQGTLTAQAPEGWTLTGLGEISIKPGDRVPISLKIKTGAPVAPSAKRVNTLAIAGNFGPGNKTVLSLRLIVDKPKARP